MPMNKEQAYQILELSVNASEAEVKKAYKRLALKHHPDKNPNDKEAHKTFLQISEAYKRITDPDSFKDEDESAEGLSEEELEAMFGMMFAEMMGFGMGGSRRGGMGIPPMEMFNMFMFGDEDEDDLEDYEEYGTSPKIYHGQMFDEDDEDDDFLDEEFLHDQFMRMGMGMRTGRDAGPYGLESIILNELMNSGQQSRHKPKGAPKAKSTSNRVSEEQERDEAWETDDSDEDDEEYDDEDGDEFEAMMEAMAEEFMFGGGLRGAGPMGDLFAALGGMPMASNQRRKPGFQSNRNEARSLNHGGKLSTAAGSDKKSKSAKKRAKAKAKAKTNKNAPSSETERVEESFQNSQAKYISKDPPSSSNAKSSSSSSRSNEGRFSASNHSYSKGGSSDEDDSQPQQKHTSGLKIGDKVLIYKRHSAKVAYVGDVHYAAGVYVGVVMDDPALGKNNGTIRGVKYFDCIGKNKGLMVQLSDVTKI